MFVTSNQPQQTSGDSEREATQGPPDPQVFGKETKKLFLIDPSFVYVNHGSFGGIPNFVEDSCQDLSRSIESNADGFIRHHLCRRIDSARAAVAKMVGAETDTCVFVPNVATGINTVLKNFDWKSGDVLVHTDLVFSTVASAIEEVCSSKPGVRASQFVIDFPVSHPSILRSFREHLQGLKKEAQSALQQPASPTIVALFESISSTPAIVLPWTDMVRICREENVWSIVDAAHSLGQEVGLELSVIDPDFWVTNCSKWLYAKRSSAILYVPFRNQKMISKPVLPALKFPSPGVHPSDFVWQFYWNGMADPVPSLSVEYALAFRDSMGGEEKINAYCHSLAMISGRRIAEILGTSVLDSPEKEGELIANMINIELPLPPTVQSSVELHLKLQEEMIEDHKTFAVLFSYKGRWWARASVQIYNELSDFEHLGRVLKVICDKLREI